MVYLEGDCGARDWAIKDHMCVAPDVGMPFQQGWVKDMVSAGLWVYYLWT